jgi:hypothetical protein
MFRDDLTPPVAAAATAQVKLCPYNEEEPHIWFRLIKAQFAAAGIKSQQLKYANALASLPKQVLWDIWDTLDVCNDCAKPFVFLKNTLLGQFGKSKWQSYFELLRLPMEMQGFKPSVLMGKLKQHLPPECRLTTTFFFNVSDPPYAIHERNSRYWRLWNGCSHGEGCRHPMGRSGRPRPYSCSRLDTAKQEPRSQQWEERRQTGR